MHLLRSPMLKYAITVTSSCHLAGGVYLMAYYKQRPGHCDARSLLTLRLFRIKFQEIQSHPCTLCVSGRCFFCQLQQSICLCISQVQSVETGKNCYSCITDKDIHVFHLYLQILSHICCLTQGRIKITCN